MFRWQTLTLARIESERAGYPYKQLDSIKEFMYSIAQRFFPEPEIGHPPLNEGENGPLVCLIWRVDDRVLLVTFHPSGKLELDCNDGSVVIEHTLKIAHYDSVRIRDVVRWLLSNQPLVPVAPDTPPANYTNQELVDLSTKHALLPVWQP